MRLSAGRRCATGAMCTTGALLFVAGAGADEVTLQSGAVVRGHASDVQLPDHSKAVEIRTPSGALIVLERDSVKQVKRIAAGQKVVQAASKPRLTAKQQAWMTKVRSLISRLTSGNRAQVQQARNELWKIHDPDALPALTRYLQQNPDEELRRIYVAILRDLPGSNAVYYLVSQSLFDSSAQIRQQAREAIGAERADNARTLYIFALKLRNPSLATRAALAIQEIGDPNGDAIPYLIEALVHEGKRAIILPKTEWGFADDWQSLFTYAQIHIISEHGGPMGLYDNPPIHVGPIPVMKNAPPAIQPAPPPPSVLVPFNVPALSILHDKDGNQTVLEALLKVTNLQPGFGYNRDKWRSWWANEKANRDLQKRPADKPISQPRPPQDAVRPRPISPGS
jgi:HEAT repeats